MLLHGSISQPQDYHHFADQRIAFGIARAADVLSNAAFALVGVWGWLALSPARRHCQLRSGWAGYRLFLIALILTAAGSAFYHLEPDNSRLIWDRLPIALACAGLLAAVRAETKPGADDASGIILLSLAAVLSVAWWHFSGSDGSGDLRPYLLLQGLPLLLIPLWQAIHPAPREDRLAFGIAIALYVAAKAAELHDRELMLFFGGISGHTIKHLLAAAAAATIVRCLIRRVKPVSASVVGVITS
ncbi:alkaline phytoceramidase [Noviherbaspirillum cavernae]|uniref:Alkaline phytoceramidase n=2 Tax=Noviherbaspirillum cavernae TaxID=2320862 RepID=A0A418WZC1_9BURK|nr:alkaline phytoceramidase [Noviherbaspirillum cavernae]